MAGDRLDHVGRDDLLESGRFRAVALCIAQFVGRLVGDSILSGVHALVGGGLQLAIKLVGLLSGALVII